MSASRSYVPFSILVPDISCSEEQLDFVVGEGFVRL